MLSTLLFELGFSALEGDMINLWLELQAGQICGNGQHHNRCTCSICSSIPKEENEYDDEKETITRHSNLCGVSLSCRVPPE